MGDKQLGANVEARMEIMGDIGVGLEEGISYGCACEGANGKQWLSDDNPVPKGEKIRGMWVDVGSKSAGSIKRLADT